MMRRRLWMIVGGALLAAAVGVAATLGPWSAEDPVVVTVSLPGGAFRAGADDLVAQVAGVLLANEMVRGTSSVPFALELATLEVKPFAMDRTEVTVTAYARCVAAGRCSSAGNGFRCSAGDRLSSRSHLPITCVDYEQAARFCAWAGKRLPTEVEWEYAARGPGSRRYPWGDAPVDVTRLCSKQAEPCAVGSRPAGATPEGILDLAGNVWEWTSSDNCGRTVGNCGNGYKAVRGGPLTYEHDEEAQARAAFRHSVPEGKRDWDLGFRCARD